MSKTSKPVQPFIGGTYTGYESILETYNRKRKETPKGISLKLQKTKNSTYILLQFVFPDTQKRSTKACNVDFTEDGIIEACKKAWKVKDALDRFDNASEFWEWYDKEILGKTEMVNDLVTYREIFEKIERSYWNGRNRNTKRKRSKDIPNDVFGFTRYYGVVFNRFVNWDKYPEWKEIESVLFSFKQGSKSFKDAYAVLKRICSMCPNKEKMIEKINGIDKEQTEFKEKQSISLDEFLSWYEQAYGVIKSLKNQQWIKARQSWLWVASMCVLYGLRPSEIATAKNLDKSVIIDGYTFKAINDPSNKDLLLVLGNKTYFGTTIKTGERVCMPMATDKKLIEKLKIQSPSLPIYKPKENSKPKTITGGFAKQLRDRINNWGCKVTETYAFRHLSNQLGERYGIPQEIRARSLGHSVVINDSVYKKRSNIRTTVDLLKNHKKETIPLDLAIETAKQLEIDNDPKVIKLLAAIYNVKESEIQ